MTVVQRFGSACELNEHFHTLVLDGVYVDGPSTGRPLFRPLPAPTLAELARVTGAVGRKVRRALRRVGLLGDELLADTANTQPELAGRPEISDVGPLSGLAALPRSHPKPTTGPGAAHDGSATSSRQADASRRTRMRCSAKMCRGR